ncbi:MAG: right-handed parallel beta-helix repeat-containing protein [Gemmatimonadetes bacterium]|nr:right-handed parallel beta-helix repeat-containing protein [Gemmatimonadota bacterium]
MIGIRVAPLLAGILLLSAGAASAEKTRRVPEDFETINAAIEAAEPGDTILVGPGTYAETIVLTDAKGDALIIKSTDGREKTRIEYVADANTNEAVVTFQRCSNSTQFLGFTIDGKGEARRGVLANSDSRPVLENVRVDGCEYGVAAHRTSVPFLRDVVITNSRTAALFITGGSADVKNARFINGEKYGIYANTATDILRLRNVQIEDNGQIGIQASDAEFELLDSTVINNGDTGILVQDTSPVIRNVKIAKHTNIGIVLEASSARIENCDIRQQEHGLICSIEGDPIIAKCTFDEAKVYHIGIEGDANPLIGGSLENANAFLGRPEVALHTSSTAAINASYNYWGFPCVPSKALENVGEGKLKRRPWMAPNLSRSFDDCTAARHYYKKWKDGKIDAQGNPIGPQEALDDNFSPEDDDAGE